MRLPAKELLLLAWATLCYFCSPLHLFPSPSAGLVGPALLSLYSLHRTIMGFHVQYVLRLLSFLKIQTLEFAFRWSYTDPVSEATSTHQGQPDQTMEMGSAQFTITYTPPRWAYALHINQPFRDNVYRALASSVQRYGCLCLGLNLSWFCKINLPVTAKYCHIVLPR